MISKDQIVHDLALVHAQEKYRGYLAASLGNAQFPTDVTTLCSFYEQAVVAVSAQIDKIEASYFDEDGTPLLP